MSKIGVIVPVYNVEKYLERCIESILNQSFKDFKLILVNDGSTDDSGKICERYKEKDPRIRVIDQENKGLSMARNKGIEASKEDYISFIDSDDYIHKDMLKILYENLIQNQADISICKYKLVYEGNKLGHARVDNRVRVLNNIDAVNKIIEKSDTNMIIAWGKIYKRSAFKHIRYPKGKYHEDEFVTYKLLYNAKRVVITEAKLYYYTQRGGSITGERYNLKRLDKLDGLKECIGFFESLGEKDLEVRSRARYLLNIQIAYYRIKYEMKNELTTMERLKEEYDIQYKDMLHERKILSKGKRIILRFFYVFPNLYCRIVKIYMNIGHAS